MTRSNIARRVVSLLVGCAFASASLLCCPWPAHVAVGSADSTRVVIERGGDLAHDVPCTSTTSRAKLCVRASRAYAGSASHLRKHARAQRPVPTIKEAAGVAGGPSFLGNEEAAALDEGEAVERVAEDVPRSLPREGVPSTTQVIDRGNESGQIREYGPDGITSKDFDFGHDHGAGDPHAHDWVDGVRQHGRQIEPGE